ncbi:MAG TPA: 3',5'-cyclic-nucleotide phosphodiesterase [Burkholderiaceae bacterium]|jgi:ribonuclease BN (tRNA processing enzyme)|nr:3',5'-cyclic-nucleotide phosphodiesterase [Burkholderiaceae bacterium]
MQVRVLGCSGGIGARARTTSFLVDHDILIDAGTGVEDLSVEELAAIDRVFLTHSHLDHIAALPLLVDSVGGLRSRPLIVHALPETILALKTHIFNWVIWPDFTEIPHYDRPWMVFEPIGIDTTVNVGGRSVRSIPANHTVPALGFHIFNERAGLVFSGDTGPNDEFWRIVNSVENLRYLIIETAFPNRDQDLAVTSRHLYPIQLGQELEKLRQEPQVLVTHLKPSDRKVIERELEAWAGRFAPRVLERGDIFEL